MKRRVLLGRTVFSTLSAGVFSAAGWLMGTRSLTMPPFVWQDVSSCILGPSDCNCTQSSGSNCTLDLSCAPGSGSYETRCRFTEYIYLACCENFPNQICRTGTRSWPCGECAGCE